MKSSSDITKDRLSHRHRNMYLAERALLDGHLLVKSGDLQEDSSSSNEHVYVYHEKRKLILLTTPELR